LTGESLPDTASETTSKRPTHFLETSQPGVFAAGDVRRGSVKRVASAVGEGSMAVKLVHNHLGS
jgi:thioredoxin reductase (NADPH)